jgi:maleylpyruvate isomerase
MPGLRQKELVARVKAAHERERSLIEGLTDEQVRAASALPGWTRGHVLASRLVFVRAAMRQIENAFTGAQNEFFDGHREGRDAQIEAHAHRSADDLVQAVALSTKALDGEWSRLDGSDWDRLIIYRGPGTLTEVLRASWRESEVHCLDLNLGARPSSWSPEFCAELFDFLASRAPEGVRLELTTPEADTWTLGAGTPVRITGILTDLAAWLAGRKPDGPVQSSTGTLPDLQRLRDARR